ncbi:PREDICTED: inducible metalloproteinase inhibitor protein [Polistes canadensis]|uniref:inducible metalloproteinase inhibitor protein n=1 Tax=Polistes canadensis TaxID=91411 RepID=UPI000718ED3C|nr:PREDICTED: inducible metalloproteinase inhibitor protein [Polistes canadensis]
MSRIFSILFVTITITLFVIVNAKNQPPIVCDQPNEEYQCGSACQTRCDTLGEPCPIINIKCNEGCYCINGYARNDNDVCVPINECPPKKVKSTPVPCNAEQ